MIGLGSNRLTVCRRGGMSVTQAGRGGMEWLAGGRMPSWASPYSAQATAALLAQFQTQWPTIRDYGFAHPEIVGYMNAYAPEDAKIAYSLVPTLGKIRWLVGDGVAYLSTIAGNKNGFYCETMLIERRQSQSSFIGAHNLSSPYGRSFLYNNSNRWHLGLGEDASISVGTIVLNTKYEVVFSTIKYNSYLIVNGSTLASATDKNTDRSTMPIMFYTDEYSVNRGNIHNCKFAYVRIGFTNEEISNNFIPFIRKVNGVDTYGMIDIITGTFYQNANSAGSFSIEYTELDGVTPS